MDYGSSRGHSHFLCLLPLAPLCLSMTPDPWHDSICTAKELAAKNSKCFNCEIQSCPGAWGKQQCSCSRLLTFACGLQAASSAHALTKVRQSSDAWPPASAMTDTTLFVCAAGSRILDHVFRFVCHWPTRHAPC